ncbi:MAG: hypothetical protein ACTSQE_15890 [Candidatus Heimdallarchaeaceae archaeon]
MKQKNSLSKKELSLKQARFIENLEGIGDVLVYETKRRKNKRVLQGLKRLEKIILDFLMLQKDNPDKFERLLLSQEFFDFYEKDKDEAHLRLGMIPERYLISFSTALNQILRIHEAAIEIKNDDLSSQASYHINGLLAHVAQIPDNSLLVEFLLRILSNVTRRAIEKQDPSMYSSSIHWYINIVFNRYGQKEGKFDLSYLPLFDRYFFSTIRYIITENQSELFKALVSFLVDGLLISYYREGDVWEYGHLLLENNFELYRQLENKFQIDKKIKHLADVKRGFSKREDLDKWLSGFEELKKVVESHLDSEQKEKAREMELKIKDEVIEQYKFDNLLEIVYAIGTFCLYRKQYEYIRYLWEYKQPPDSDASWIGPNIVQTTLDGAIRFYFRRSLFEGRFISYEGHHGSEIYQKKYFLLLLSKILQSYQKTDDKYVQIEKYSVPDLHIYRLKDIESSVAEFVNISNSLKQERKMLAALGFNDDEIDELFDAKVIPLLNKLKVQAQDKISYIKRTQPPSVAKIKEFKEEVLKGFWGSAELRQMFKYYNLFCDKSDVEYNGTIKKFGINQLYDKAAFFDEWYVSYADWGVQYGHNMAAGEDSYVAETISSQCKKIKREDFELTLNKFSNLSDIIVLATNVSVTGFFEDSDNFKAKWRFDRPKLDLKAFEGWYLFRETYIPVFRVYQRKTERLILILNKSRLGNWIQYNPIDEGESEDFRKDLFYMNIRAFSEDKELLAESLEKGPEWLQKKGDKNKQAAYLQEMVLIQIFERMEFKAHEKFEGYSIIVERK